VSAVFICSWLELLVVGLIICGCGSFTQIVLLYMLLLWIVPISVY
jgi:hypothetical protein